MGIVQKALSAAALLVAFLAGPGLTLSLPEMQTAAVAAVKAGDDAAARAMAREILVVHPGDALAEFVLTVVEMRGGNLPEARTHGRRAFRLADSDQQKFQAAMIAADIADREDRPLALRFWLRQAADVAPREVEKKAVLGVLAEEKARSPFSFGLSLSLAPSSNVNNGSSSPYNIIDGFYPVGLISAEGQALSGWEGSLRANLAWVVAEDAQRRTELTVTASHLAVALSPEAKRAAPDLSGSDLGDSVLNFGLRRSWVTPDGQAKNVVSLEIGRGWSGVGTFRDLVELNLSQQRRLKGGQALSYGLETIWTMPESPARSDTRRTTLKLAYGMGLANSDRIFADLALSDTTAGPGNDRTSRDMRSVMLRTGWGRAKPVGPFTLSASIGANYSDYPDYRLGFISVPGGRQDVTGFGDVTLGFDRLSIAGFQPTLSLRVLSTHSNVSAFTTRDTSLGFGLSAEF